MCSTWFLVAFTQMVQTRKTSQNVYSKWSQNNRLVIQVMKSFAMFLSRRKQFSTDPVVHLDGTTLETRPCADYLEVCIENQLSWKEQVKKVTGRAYGALRNLRQVQHSLPLHTGNLLYRALVLPIIEYCSVVWDPSTAILKVKLERVQKYSIQPAWSLTNHPGLRLRNCETPWIGRHYKREGVFGMLN